MKTSTERVTNVQIQDNKQNGVQKIINIAKLEKLMDGVHL